MVGNDAGGIAFACVVVIRTVTSSRKKGPPYSCC